MLHATRADADERDRAAARARADHRQEVDWLEEMGVVAIDENGTWQLTALGEAAMARFYAQSRRLVRPRGAF
jgi:hypothetical protein